jgi:hypothetical protein
MKLELSIESKTLRIIILLLDLLSIWLFLSAKYLAFSGYMVSSSALISIVADISAGLLFIMGLYYLMKQAYFRAFILHLIPLLIFISTFIAASFDYIRLLTELIWGTSEAVGFAGDPSRYLLYAPLATIPICIINCTQILTLYLKLSEEPQKIER